MTWPIALSISEALAGCSRVVYFPRREVPCRACLGTGQTASGPCRDCEGTGWAEIIKRVPVDLPPIPDHCARVRIAGAGEYVAESGTFGDLSLICHVVPQDGLMLVGGQLRATLPVSPEQATIGGVFTLSLPGGPLEVQLPGPLADGGHYAFHTSALVPNREHTVIIQISILEATAPTPVDTGTISQLYADASNAERARDFAQAGDLYAEIARIEPSARALRKCGWMHLRLGDSDRAIGCLAQAVQADWDSAEAHYYKGAVHYKRGEFLPALVEVEIAHHLGMREPQVDKVREGSLRRVFRPLDDLPSSEHDRSVAAAAAAFGRYYGSAATGLREVLETTPRPRIYYQYGAACWLLSLDGTEDRMADAYLALRAAASLTADDGEVCAAFRELDTVLHTRGSVASQIAVAGHLLRQGEAPDAWRHVDAASRSLGTRGLMSDRDASAADEALGNAVTTCEHLAAVIRPAHRAWGHALAGASPAAGRLRDMVTALSAGAQPVVGSTVQAAHREAAAMGHEVLLPACADLQAYLEREYRALPLTCHAWLESLISSATRLKDDLRNLARSRRPSRGAQADSLRVDIAALEQLSRTAGALERTIADQLDGLDSTLYYALQCWSRMLHMRTGVSGHLGREDHLARCQALAQAVRLAEMARSMRPDASTDTDDRRAVCALLDDFQDAAQEAAGTGAFARAEFFQNTIDSLRAGVLASPVLAASVPDFLQEEKLRVFDWACNVLFATAGALPQEFLVDARPQCYALTNFRVAHRQTDATTFVLIPLSSVQRYDARASGATTCVATFTLRDGRRVAFNSVPVEDAIPGERMKWLLGARMWGDLTEAELEALEAGRPAPTAQLAAESAHDRRRLLGDARPAQLGTGGETAVCRSCGRHNFAQDRFCRECGARLGPDQPTALPTEEPPALSAGDHPQKGS